MICLLKKMSDWASIRYSKKPQDPKKEGVNFVYEEEEEDDFDDDVQEEKQVEEVKVKEEEIPVSNISEEQMQAIVYVVTTLINLGKKGFV